MTTALEDALARYRARLSPPSMTYQTGPNTACPVRREGDELVCVCGLRWDAKEERPACPR